MTFHYVADTISFGCPSESTRELPPLAEVEAYPVKVGEKIKVQPRRQCIVFARIGGNHPGGPLLFEASMERLGAVGLAAAGAVVMPSEGCIPIRLMNPLDYSITIKAGTQLGVVEAVYDRDGKPHVKGLPKSHHGGSVLPLLGFQPRDSVSHVSGPLIDFDPAHSLLDSP